MSEVGSAPAGGLRLRLGGFDPDAVARAEAALKSLSANFEAWLADEIAKLKAARGRIDSAGLTAETAEALYMRAHDLKGLGATYQYPIITTIAGLLCKFTDKPEQRLKAPLALVDAHIGAIEAAVAGDIRTEEDPRGAAAVAALDAAVRQHLGT
ncbi:MAG TPA: Hpt domain-containing protein [Caulobacteraceae bacterium]|nr:Hpt domain-containing protein [Caulobacteraceae bacterium]